jgi:hypothetical protein
MSEQPRTEVLRRRIGLYQHCISEGITALACPTSFIRSLKPKTSCY